MPKNRNIVSCVIAGATALLVTRLCNDLRRARRLAAAQASFGGHLEPARIARELADAARSLVRAEEVEVMAERADGELCQLARRGRSESSPTTLRNGSDLVRVRRRRRLSTSERSDLESLLAVGSQAGRVARLYELTETLRGEAMVRERERAVLAARLLETEEQERRRLALALHDGPQQTMAGVALMLDAAVEAQREGDVQQAEEIVLGALEQAREIVRSLRGLGFALEPILLRDHGFTAAFSELADIAAKRHRLAIEVEAGQLDALEIGVQVHLYRIAQEALANAIKHARGATTVRAQAERRADGSFVLCISDDGCGAEPDQFDRRGIHRGMHAMRERAAGAGGELFVDSAPGRGTRIEVVIPPSGEVRWAA